MERAPSRARLNGGEYKRLRAYGWLWAVAASAIAVVFVFTAWLFAVQAADGGLSPYIERADVVLFNRLSTFFRAPERGDVVAFQKGGEGPVYISRIVGMPGEEVEIYGGLVYINGVLLDESAYVSGESIDMEKTRVGNGEYLVLPDAREHANVFETEELILNARGIIGTALFRVYPLSRLALFK